MNTGHKKVIDIIKKYDFFIKKGYGQNFLVDQNIVNKIVEGAQLTKDDIVLEVGPGIGALTDALAPRCHKVICVEIDKSLIPILKDNLVAQNVEIIQGDILKIDIPQLLEPYSRVKVVANLPYYISTPIINAFLGTKAVSLTMMMQKEVGDRLYARPKTKAYGSLTLAISYHCDITLIGNVSKHCFIPQPNVDSMVLRFDLRKPTTTPTNEEFLFNFIRAAFSKRRKTLVNAVSSWASWDGINIQKEDLERALKKINKATNIRAEELSLEEYIKLTDTIIHDL